MKFWKKIVQNFARFLTTFDFNHEYLRSGSTYHKSEKLLKIYNHSHIGWKKFMYFGPQTTKLFPLIYLHPNWLLSGDYISALRGAVPSNASSTLGLQSVGLTYCWLGHRRLWLTSYSYSNRCGTYAVMNECSRADSGSSDRRTQKLKTYTLITTAIMC